MNWLDAGDPLQFYAHSIENVNINAKNTIWCLWIFYTLNYVVV